MPGAREPSLLPDDDSREPIVEHVARIGEVLRDASSIECGHSSWSSIPLSNRDLPAERSHHSSRAPSGAGVEAVASSINRLVDDGAIREGALLLAEVNALAIERRADVWRMRVRSEDLFRRVTVEQTLKFAGPTPVSFTRHPEVLASRISSDKTRSISTRSRFATNTSPSECDDSALQFQRIHRSMWG